MPLPPGTRNQVEVGVQQALGRWVVVDFGYFNKRTDNAYDFGVLFDTPIVFPVSWDHSKIDGFTGRINLVEHGGFSAFVVMAHTNAIFSPPGNGGIFVEQATRRLPDRPRSEVQATTNLQYDVRQAARRLGRAQLALRLGPGRRLGARLRDALALTGDQQAAIGLFCGSTVATRDSPIDELLVVGSRRRRG